MKNPKSVFTAILAMTMILNMAIAQDVRSVSYVSSNEPLTVSYLGNQGEYLLFQVEIKTGAIRHSLLSLEDKTEGELYATSVKGNNKTMTFKVEKIENQVIAFKLFSGKNSYSITFTGNTGAFHMATADQSNSVRL